MKRFAGMPLFALTLTLAGCGAGVPEAGAAEGDNIAQENIQALGTCYAGSCDNQDPGATGCEADAYTAASSSLRNQFGAVIGTVAIRYSPSCRAVWTRTSLNSGTAFLRAEISRGGVTSQSAPPAVMNALRSRMLGVLASGTLFTGRGNAGSFYGDTSSSGNVSVVIY